MHVEYHTRLGGDGSKNRRLVVELVLTDQRVVMSSMFRDLETHVWRDEKNPLLCWWDDADAVNDAVTRSLGFQHAELVDVITKPGAACTLEVEEVFG